MSESGLSVSTSTQRAGVAQTQAIVRRNRAVGAHLSRPGEGDYRHIILEVPTAAGFAAAARPGQFVALTVGGDPSGLLLRRAFSIHKVTAGGEAPGGDVDPFSGQAPQRGDRIELIVAAHGPGTQWLAAATDGTLVDLVGPLGRPFPLPTQPVGCVLVGGGYGSAPLFWLADTLRGRGCRVEMVLGAAHSTRLFGVDLAQESADAVVVTTDDGSFGIKGWVSDVLPEVIRGSDAAVVYACGPMGMLASVATLAAEHGIVAQVAVEESMACGIGVCMTCVMPVADKNGEVSMVRSCVEGPTFRGDRVCWDAFDAGRVHVPANAVGAGSGSLAAPPEPTSEATPLATTGAATSPVISPAVQSAAAGVGGSGTTAAERGGEDG